MTNTETNYSPDTAGTGEASQDKGGGAESLLGDVKSQLGAAAEARGEQIADTLEEAAEAVKHSGEQLEGHQDWIAGLVENGAEELKSLAASVRDKNFDGLLTHFEDLARRQPAVFVGAAMAAGFALVRLGKAGLSATSAGTSAREG